MKIDNIIDNIFAFVQVDKDGKERVLYAQEGKKTVPFVFHDPNLGVTLLDDAVLIGKQHGAEVRLVVFSRSNVTTVLGKQGGDIEN